MIRLNTTTRSLRAFLAGAITTNQLAVTVGYSDGTSEAYTGAAQLSLTNGVTPVTICAAPVSGVVRHIDYIAVSNTDTAAATVTIQLNDNGTFYEQVKATLAAGRQLIYTHASGWNVGDVNATPIGANPSASVGLAAVNGTALTFMRSDAAPALDQAIAPTWTGTHRWTQPLGVNVAPSGWNFGAGTGGAIDIGAVGTVSSISGIGGEGTDITRNAYFDSTVWKYKTAAPASRVSHVGGAVNMYTAIAGTVGATITWIQTFMMSTAGNLSLIGKLWAGTPAGAMQSACGIYAGTGAPSNSDGSNGDIYFRSDGGALTTIYQKRAGAWVGII